MARRRLPGRPKKAAADHAHVVLIDETGLFMNPVVRRSWSQVGRTPVVPGDAGHRRKVSVIGAITVSPRSHRLGFYFATAADGYFSAAQVVAFLRNLLAHLPGKVVVIWDNGSNHGGPLVRAFLRRTRRLALVRLPPYSPHLNPVEAVWSWLKWGRLANYAPERPAELDDWAAEYPVGLKCNQRLLRALWDRSELPFPTLAAERPGLPASQ